MDAFMQQLLECNILKQVNTKERGKHPYQQRTFKEVFGHLILFPEFHVTIDGTVALVRHKHANLSLSRFNYCVALDNTTQKTRVF
jgi:hypothetical protein